jgi:hypothetical protein
MTRLSNTRAEQGAESALNYSVLPDVNGHSWELTQDNGQVIASGTEATHLRALVSAMREGMRCFGPD